MRSTPVRRLAAGCRNALIAALAVLLGACAQNPVTGTPDFVTLSEAEEIRIGGEEDRSVRRQYGVLAAADLQKYVSEIGLRLARASHRPDLPYRFTVVDSPEVNAFALPGGYVYVTRGILAYLGSEAELAAVLGHEIGHVTARHSVRQVSASQATGVVATIASILVPGLRNDAAQSLVGLLGNAMLSGYGREHELEADRLGAEYLARTGYDPQAMIRVVGVLKNQELFDTEVAKKEGREPRRYHGLFASHPDNDTRLKEVIAQAGKVAPTGRREDRDTFLRMLDGSVYGDSPAQGFVRDGTFHHPELGFALRFPPRWKIDNRSDRVLAVSPDKDAMVELRAAGTPKGTPADMLRQALRLGVGSRVEIADTNGLPSASTTTSQQGRPALATLLFHDGAAYLVGAQAAGPQAMAKREAELRAVARSFRATSTEERRSVRPRILKLVVAQPGTTWAQLAAKSPLGEHAESELRLLNGQYPSGEPAAGQTIKVIE